MQATVTTSNGLERVVNFTVPAQDFEKALDEKINYLAKNRRVAGFRPGKIPDQLLESISVPKLITQLSTILLTTA